MTPQLQVKFYGQAPTEAVRVATKIHIQAPRSGESETSESRGALKTASRIDDEN